MGRGKPSRIVVGPEEEVPPTASASSPVELQKHPADVQEALALANKGDALIKVRSRSGQYRRFFRVEGGGMTLVYDDSRKNRFQRRSADQSRVSIDKIQEIREGRESDVFRKSFRRHSSPPESSCCFTITITGQRTLDLVAPNAEARNLWLKALKHLMKYLDEANPTVIHNLFLRDAFRKADVNNDMALDLSEILKLLKHMNLSVDEHWASEKCQEAIEVTAKQLKDVPSKVQKRSDESLTIEEFAVFYDLISRQQEIENIFQMYDHGMGILTAEDLTHFWQKEQQEELKPKDIEEILQTFSDQDEKKKVPTATLR